MTHCSCAISQFKCQIVPHLHAFIYYAATGAKLLSKHLEQQKQERDKLADHRKKCYKFSEKYLGIVIDGMDQSKTSLPHWYRVPKNADPNYFVHVYLVGALIFNGEMRSCVFLTYPNLRNDGNLTITIIQTIICDFVGTLPHVLFLQLDNTARENKNNLLMSYLHFLVATKVFQKVKINFLLVGHTHDQIDQMFSRFSKKLARTKAFTLVSFLEVIRESYTPIPIVTMLTDAYDFRRFALTEPYIVVSNMHNLSFSHAFIIKFKSPSDRVPSQWAKKLSTDTIWKSETGVVLLKEDFQIKVIFLTERLPLQKKGERTQQIVTTGSASLFTHEEMEVFLQNIEKHILSLSQYFLLEEVGWWRGFFEDQRGLNRRLLEPLSPLDNFHYCCEGRVSPPEAVADPLVVVPDEDKMNRVVFGPERPIYVGSYKYPHALELEKENMEADMKDLEVGTMICVLATDCPDNQPFWLTQVESIKSFLEDGTPENIFITWFACSKEEDDPFVEKYREEVSSEDRAQRSARGKKGKQKGLTNQQDLNISGTTVLSYNFALTNMRTMYKKTIQRIQAKLSEVDDN